MIWPDSFESRLLAWNQLRSEAEQLDPAQALSAINDWWWHAPMVNNRLRWRDIDSWPGPWDLLDDNCFCDLARALGMLYTVMMLQHSELFDVYLIETENNNLVQVNDGIYILNWSPGQIVNIQSKNIVVKRQISSDRFKKLIG